MAESKTIYLLPHQAEFIEDTEHKYLGLITGYGGGKSYSLCQKALDLAHRNAGYKGLLLEPNAPLLYDILVPEWERTLEEYGVPYDLKKSPNYNYTLHFPEGDTLVMLRSFENWERLIGVNAAFIGVDEVDTVKQDIAERAVQKLQGRLRAGNVRQMFFTTTPEGFKWAYDFFVTGAHPTKRMIQASTEDNIFLPQDFIDSLYEMYPANLIRAYLHGEFVNLTGNVVYEYFDHDRHVIEPSEIEYDHSDEILVGMDFNVGGCVAVAAIEDSDTGELYVIDTLIEHDTFRMGQKLLMEYGSYADIIIHPDASGGNMSTNSSKTDLDILNDEFGFMINAPKKNPYIADRVLSTNNMFRKNKLFIVQNEANKFLIDALEMQVYDEKGKPEKSDKHPSRDDANDSLGYLVSRRYPVRKPSWSSYKSV